ncbi:hypothetical protein ACIP4Y_37845 [Streptomyces sp. NPDC088810]|uniref:MmyB family transcriptional regulator n=1 Tax=Streptomyces sp. NPDC088810 TaxID=3365904 RepID=UPI003820CEE6
MNTTVSLLRTEAGCAPHDRELTGLIGELVTRSGEFRTAWAEHNVRLHHTGRKSFRHPPPSASSPSPPGPSRRRPTPRTAPTARPRRTADVTCQLAVSWK